MALFSLFFAMDSIANESTRTQPQWLLLFFIFFFWNKNNDDVTYVMCVEYTRPTWFQFLQFNDTSYNLLHTHFIRTHQVTHERMVEFYIFRSSSGMDGCELFGMGNDNTTQQIHRSLSLFRVRKHLQIRTKFINSL